MNIALIEFNPFHDECLYSQIMFLHSMPENKVFLVYNHNLKDRIDYWDKLDGHLSIGSNQWLIGYYKILRFLKRKKVDIVIFNSTHYSSVSSLLKYGPKVGRKYFGLVHDLNDISQKQTVELKMNMTGYFVLNDYLLDSSQNLDTSGARLSSFYPIYFPKQQVREVVKADDEIWITIPGLMESFRRDYESLLNSFSSGTLNRNIKLIFLGRSIFKKRQKTNLRKQFEEVDQYNQCIFWDEFVDKSTFHTYMMHSDYLLPLIHPGHRASNRFEDKISGSFNLGFGYSKPFVMDRYFEKVEDFKNNAVFYDSEDDLISTLNNLEIPKSEAFYQNPKWDFEYQSKKYLEFLGLNK